VQPLFITASGTDIGKTLITTTLCWQLRQQGKSVTALKPVITGYKEQDLNNDAALILKSCGLKPTPALIKTLSPWRFAAPLSPNMAAAREGATLNFDALVAFCREHAVLESDVVLVEGVGGVMVPLNDEKLVLDWIQALAWPAILVTGTYLGAISHTLTAMGALQSRDIPVRALVISESENSSAPLDDTATTLKRFIPENIPIVKIPRWRDTEDMWKAMPLITWMCEP
jgi:dethiobiotin synthetase